jgi:uracil phosphoribosyltransferase
VYSWFVPVHKVEHPLALEALTILRSADTRPDQFRRVARRISMLLTVEATRDIETTPTTVLTPLGSTTGHRLARDVVVVPILRAGLGMLEAVLELIPAARVGYVGLQRDENTAIASRYYSNLPSNLEESHVLVIDPMLATGGSALAALDLLCSAGAIDVRVICIVAAPEGIEALERHYPGIRIFTPAVDRGLNDQKFIVPGLGDFGNRLYGTE